MPGILQFYQANINYLRKKREESFYEVGAFTRINTVIHYAITVKKKNDHLWGRINFDATLQTIWYLHSAQVARCLKSLNGHNARHNMLKTFCCPKLVNNSLGCFLSSYMFEII